MAKDRADRPQTAGELVAELRAALGAEPGGGVPAPPAAGAGAGNLTDAGRARGTQGEGAGGGATAHRPPDTHAGRLDQSRAETLLTSELESPASTSAGRETASQPARPVTSGNVAAQRGRETVASCAAGTQADAGADSWHEVPGGQGQAAP